MYIDLVLFYVVNKLIECLFNVFIRNCYNNQVIYLSVVVVIARCIKIYGVAELKFED